MNSKLFAENKAIKKSLVNDFLEEQLDYNELINSIGGVEDTVIDRDMFNKELNVSTNQGIQTENNLSVFYFFRSLRNLLSGIYRR